MIDTTTHQVIATIPVKANPHFLVLGPDRHIWGTNTGENDIYVIDPATQTKVATLEVGPNPQQIAFGYKGMAGPFAYVTVGGLNKIAVVSTDVKNLRILVQPAGITQRVPLVAARRISRAVLFSCTSTESASGDD